MWLQILWLILGLALLVKGGALFVSAQQLPEHEAAVPSSLSTQVSSGEQSVAEAQAFPVLTFAWRGALHAAGAASAGGFTFLSGVGPGRSGLETTPSLGSELPSFLGPRSFWACFVSPPQAIANATDEAATQMKIRPKLITFLR